MPKFSKQVQILYEMCACAIVEGRATLEGAQEVGFDVYAAMFSVGKTSQLANIHSQTLRQYDRLGLIVPQRTNGGARRYCLRDINRLVKAQYLSHKEGINLEGIRRILVLEEENRVLKRRIQQLTIDRESTVFTADPDGRIVPINMSDGIEVREHVGKRIVKPLPTSPHNKSYYQDRSVIVWSNY